MLISIVKSCLEFYFDIQQALSELLLTGFAKQAFLADVANPYQLPDGTPSFQDFMGSKNNRFINPEMASKNRIQPPSKILHFFNTPPGLEADNIETLFTEHGSPKPKCVKMFPSKTERSSSGLIEFESLSDALEGLVICNHQPVANPNGKFPYIMKLCFSAIAMSCSPNDSVKSGYRSQCVLSMQISGPRISAISRSSFAVVTSAATHKFVVFVSIICFEEM